MSSIRKCRTCMSYAAMESQCRKNPPIAAVMGVSQRGDPLVIGMFPFAAPDNWCGAYEEDSAAVAASLNQQQTNPRENSIVVAGSGNA